MQPLPTLDKILSTLTETDCIETLSIDLCGTIDDTSHNIYSFSDTFEIDFCFY